MIDLPIGTKFYIGNRLIEVVDDMGKYLCSDCVLRFNIDVPCGIFECYKYGRKDRTDVIFKEVKNG